MWCGLTIRSWSRRRLIPSDQGSAGGGAAVSGGHCQPPLLHWTQDCTLTLHMIVIGHKYETCLDQGKPSKKVWIFSWTNVDYWDSWGWLEIGIPTVAQKSNGVISDFGLWLAWMTGTDDWHEWLAWMTGMDEWQGWLAWMNGRDDWHGWLAWMAGMDDWDDYPRL